MKVKVMTAFRDRTKDLHLQEAGTVLEVTKERAAVLINRGLAEEVEEQKKKEK